MTFFIMLFMVWLQTFNFLLFVSKFSRKKDKHVVKLSTFLRKFFNDSNFMVKESNVIFFPLQSTNIKNRVQMRPILYSSQPIKLQIFFRVSYNIFQTTRFNHTMIFFQVKKDHSIIESHRLKIAFVFFQTILKFVLSRKIINYLFLSFAPRSS